MKSIINGYKTNDIKLNIKIDNIVTIHYFEYSKNYIFEGESHEFWEFLYVDKGEINVIADDKKYIIGKDQMIFHQPNEWHNVFANGEVAPNLIVISFICKDSAMNFFKNKLLYVDNKIKTFLSIIINEALNAYSSKLNDPSTIELIKKKNCNFGCEQLIKNYLEIILIEFIRNESKYKIKANISTSVQKFDSDEKLSVIIRYLNEHARNRITLDDISHDTLLSKSSIQKLFSDSLDVSPMEYFANIKIDEAKLLIREGNHNFTQIASILSYQSIHYFSRVFKLKTGMTLTEYASSVKLLLKNNNFNLVD